MRIPISIEEDSDDKACARRRIVIGEEEIYLLDEITMYEVGLIFRSFGNMLIAEYDMNNKE